MYGDEVNAGRFKECIDFRFGYVKGKYCIAMLKAFHSNQNMANAKLSIGSAYHGMITSSHGNIMSGICAPESCSPREIVGFGNSLLVNSQLRVMNVKCYEPPQLQAFDIFAM